MVTTILSQVSHIWPDTDIWKWGTFYCKCSNNCEIQVDILQFRNIEWVPKEQETSGPIDTAKCAVLMKILMKIIVLFCNG